MVEQPGAGRHDREVGRRRVRYGNQANQPVFQRERPIVRKMQAAHSQQVAAARQDFLIRQLRLAALARQQLQPIGLTPGGDSLPGYPEFPGSPPGPVAARRTTRPAAAARSARHRPGWQSPCSPSSGRSRTAPSAHVRTGMRWPGRQAPVNIWFSIVSRIFSCRVAGSVFCVLVMSPAIVRASGHSARRPRPGRDARHPIPACGRPRHTATRPDPWPPAKMKLSNMSSPPRATSAGWPAFSDTISAGAPTFSPCHRRPAPARRRPARRRTKRGRSIGRRRRPVRCASGRAGAGHIPAAAIPRPS